MNRTMGPSLAFASLLLTASSATATQWTHPPSSTTIEGIAVATLSPHWKRADVLTREMLSPDLRASWDRDAQPCMGFTRSDDFNRDGREDRAIAGVYEARDGTFGRFALILARVSTSKWEVAFLLEEPGDSGISVLCSEGGTLVWSPCFHCDYYATIVWTGDAYKATWIDGGEID